MVPMTLSKPNKLSRKNKADVVAMARALIADPQAVRKASAGQAESIRPCIRCNKCINRSHERFLSVRCSVNPVIGWEDEVFNFPAPLKSKNVLVIGGGPAGLEAARVAAERGHNVTLMEKEPVLGGALIAASAAPFKKDMRKYLDWSVSCCSEHYRPDHKVKHPRRPLIRF